MPTLRLKRRWGMVFLKPCRDAIAYGLEFITPSSAYLYLRFVQHATPASLQPFRASLRKEL